MKFLFWPALGLLAGVASAQSPSLEEVVDLPSVRSVVISPDGERAAILRRTTDREANRYLYKVELAEKGELVPLADPKGRSIYGLAWSPDGRFVAYLASEGGSQIFLRDMNDGSVRQITAIVGGVSSYVWAPDGKTMALLLQESPSAAEVQREDRYGAFTLEGQVHDYQHLWLLDLSAERPAERGASTLRRLTGGVTLPLAAISGAISASHAMAAKSCSTMLSPTIRKTWIPKTSRPSTLLPEPYAQSFAHLASIRRPNLRPTANGSFFIEHRRRHTGLAANTALPWPPCPEVRPR